jgi:cell volume regulation protein A
MQLDTSTTDLALAMLAFGGLAAIAAIMTRVGRRTSVPVALVFLGLGVLAGEEGVGGIVFDDHVLAYRLGTVALVLILFDGGLNTRFERVRPHLGPALTLATAGVVINAAIVAAGARLVGFTLPHALLLGAVTSCTDAAAVFSVLRGSRIHLPPRVDATLELESGLNDPMAVILTTAMTAYAATGHLDLLALVWKVPLELAVGTAIGVGAGLACRVVLTRFAPSAIGLLPIVTAASAAIAFGAATLAHGSGFLAVYVAGLVLGNRYLPDRAGLRRVHDFVAWVSQVAMFLALGLLVSPRELGLVLLPSIALALILVAVARPIAVAACLAPWRHPRREIAYVGWVGLRGAVPIILSAFPMIAGVPGAREVFHVVFVVIVISALVQGTTVKWLTRRLGLEQAVPPPPPAALEIASMRRLDATIACYHVDAATAVAGVTIAEVPFPDHAAVMLLVRDDELMAPRGATRFVPGDHVFVFCRPDDEPTLALWFGRRLDD